MKTNNMKTRRSHPLLVWMVLLFAMTNIAVLLEAERCNTISVAASNGQVVATAGDPMLYFASMAATIGSGLIILGAAVVWVINFAKQVAKPNTPAKTTATPVAKTIKNNVKGAQPKTKKTVAKTRSDTRTATKAIKNTKASAKKKVSKATKAVAKK